MEHIKGKLRLERYTRNEFDTILMIDELNLTRVDLNVCVFRVGLNADREAVLLIWLVKSFHLHGAILRRLPTRESKSCSHDVDFNFRSVIVNFHLLLTRKQKGKITLACLFCIYEGGK